MSKADKPAYAMSRRTIAAVTALCLLALATAVWLDNGKAPLIQLPKTEDEQILCDFAKYDGKSFLVVNVVDGDTIDINIPDGKYEHTRIRLWGVDTPETKDPRTGVMYFGPEASEETRQLTLGKLVTVYLEERDTRDKYNRLLAYILLPDRTYLNETLLSEGYAYADTRFRHIFYNKYKQLESAARSAKKGLWENVQPDQMPQWRQN
jgi:micrococcal nuclease